MRACIMRACRYEQAKNELQSLLSGIGESERGRFNNIKNREYFSQSVGGLMALSRILDGRLPEIVRDGQGRPHFAEGDIDFNISHSGELCAAVLLERGKVGIDIEMLEGDIERQRKIANRYFTEKEKKLLADSKKPQLDFFLLWTRKEAYAKCIGEGLSSLLAGKDTACAELFVYSYVISCDEKSYIMSICADEDESIELICSDENISIERIENEYQGYSK